MYKTNRQDVPIDIIPCLPPGLSFLRIAHVLPQLGLVNIYLNDRPVIRANYLDFSPYFPIVPGIYDFRFYSPQNNTLLFEIDDLEVPTDQISTLVVTGDLENLGVVQVLSDINQRVDADETKIRIFNLTLDKLAFNINSSNYNNSGELQERSGTNYLEIPPGEARLQVQRPNGNIQSLNLTLNPGRIYTIYVAESLDPTSPSYELGNILQFIQVVDGNTILHKCI
jgi:Domain of unknown function (DUF4397)